MVKHAAPKRGDIVSLNFDPQLGREQAGKRPALILSPQAYNEKTGLAVCCPITSHAKGYPFEVALSKDMKTKGVVLVDHVKCLDWRAREARVTERIPVSVYGQVAKKLWLLVAN